MSGVMFDAVEFGTNRIGRNVEARSQIFLDSGEAFHHPCAVHGKFRHAHRESDFGAEAGPGIARDRDVVDFGEPYAGLVETILNRPHGQARGVFDAIEALFFDRSNQAPVDDDRR